MLTRMGLIKFHMGCRGWLKKGVYSGIMNKDTAVDIHFIVFYALVPPPVLPCIYLRISGALAE